MNHEDCLSKGSGRFQIWCTNGCGHTLNHRVNYGRQLQCLLVMKTFELFLKWLLQNGNLQCSYYVSVLFRYVHGPWLAAVMIASGYAALKIYRVIINYLVAKIVAYFRNGYRHKTILNRREKLIKFSWAVLIVTYQPREALRSLSKENDVSRANGLDRTSSTRYLAP